MQQPKKKKINDDDIELLIDDNFENVDVLIQDNEETEEQEEIEE